MTDRYTGTPVSWVEGTSPQKWALQDGNGTTDYEHALSDHLRAQGLHFTQHKFSKCCSPGCKSQWRYTVSDGKRFCGTHRNKHLRSLTKVVKYKVINLD